VRTEGRSEYELVSASFAQGFDFIQTLPRRAADGEGLDEFRIDLPEGVAYQRELGFKLNLPRFIKDHFYQ
jgi:hypothetical protein